MRVLLCDDHQLLTEALADVLRARGDEVRFTSTPAEAVVVASRWAPDLCLMDRSFPGGDLGVAGARQVLAVAPAVRVLMLTGDPDPVCARAALAVGVRGFLCKDEPLEAVLLAADQVAAGLLVVDRNVLRPRPAAAPGPAPLLTSREQEVLERLVGGESTQAMARDLGVSYSTVRTHVQNLLTKLGVHSQLEAAAHAVEHGLVGVRAAG